MEWKLLQHYPVTADSYTTVSTETGPESRIYVQLFNGTRLTLLESDNLAAFDIEAWAKPLEDFVFEPILYAVVEDGRNFVITYPTPEQVHNYLAVQAASGRDLMGVKLVVDEIIGSI